MKTQAKVVHIGEDYCKVEFNGQDYELPLIVADMLPTKHEITLPRAKVQQMTSPRSWKPVANQFIIETEEGDFFQSYASIIAFKRNDGKVFLDDGYWDYSATTGKYRNEFLNEGIADTRKKIESGEYTLINLN